MWRALGSPRRRQLACGACDCPCVHSSNRPIVCAAPTELDCLWVARVHWRCAAHTVTGKIKLELVAGKANPAPPVGPALGAKVRGRGRG
jgi:hypothetical protein